MKKKFGQNFLRNADLIKKIIDYADINKNSIIYEVGAGDGSLTKEIIKKNPEELISLEIDQSLEPKLFPIFENTKYKIFYEDALNFNESKYFKKKTIIISNLPYNISLKLLIKWIYQYSKIRWFDKMILMFQKEVGERIAAEENNKKYGRITLLVSAFFNVTKILNVGKNNFYPVPKVDSVVLMFEPLNKPKMNYAELNKLEYISKHLFSSRRKKLKNKLKAIFHNDIITKHNLENFYNFRAENLTKENYYFLSKLLSS